MKLNGKDANRTLHAHPQEDGGFILIERTKYLPIGYSKSKWDEQRIFIASAEVELLAGAALVKAVGK